MALSASPGSPRTLYSTIQLSGPDDGKIRRKRTIISPGQLSSLETRYKQEQWPNRETKEKLAKEIGMSTHFVNIWFQNKRSRMKKLAQEEAELAAMRQKGITYLEAQQQTGQNQKREKQQAIAPLTEKSAHPSSASPSVQPTYTPNTSPVIHKFPICVQSPVRSPRSLQSPLITLSPNNTKLHVGGGDIINIFDQDRTRKSDAAEKTANFDIVPEKQSQVGQLANLDKKYEPGTVSTNEHHQVAMTTPKTAVNQIQLLAQQQQQQQQQLQQNLKQQQIKMQQKPHVRYGTNNLQLPKRVDAVNTPSCSTTPASTDNVDTLPANLFDCLVAMVALEEGGMVQKDDANYDTAVNSALYGIKVEDTMLLNYDKKKGFKFESNESDEI